MKANSRHELRAAAALAIALGLLATPLPAAAQTTRPLADRAPTAASETVQLPDRAHGNSPPLVGFSLGFETRRDRFDYHFENASSFDSAGLVPHFFEQAYDADNLWLTARAGYRLGGRLLETEAGASLSSEGVGSDYDTFFQPDGDVIVYGTTATTDLQSWRAAQYVGLGSWHGLALRVGYAYRRDRSLFRPSETTITRTQPPSSSSFWNADRETTTSETHQVLLGATHLFVGRTWSARLGADVAPATLARLTTELPDKYDEPVVSSASAFTLTARVDAARRLGRWALGARVECSRARSYSEASRFHWSGLGGQLLVAFR